MTRPSRIRRAPPSASSQTGMTLIEVLVALLIFSFGLLGLAGLQARAIGFSTSAEDTNRAALIAQQMAFMITDTQQLDQATANTTAYNAWVARVSDPASGGMSGGIGSVTVAAGAATITVQWKSANARSTDPSSRYVTQVVLP